MKDVKDYTKDELYGIGRKAMFEYRIHGRLRSGTLKELRRRHLDEYVEIRRELKAQMTSEINLVLDEYDDSRFAAFGIHVIEMRRRYAAKWKAKQTLDWVI